ncbi:hypothetical protein K2173_028047 [Erythroxylum novogranatense]|uniref:Sialate O-acetylesterase domain-containing protein n=1 Tax=Erythroxylum novogranatense TaxID=1862640 RepID=A0AAV8U0X3_9ROSI|nr:hypothetical protein K2173_028047 [Erythroxylum novogranatense]
MSCVISFFFMILLPQFGGGGNLTKDIFLLGGESNMVGQGGVFNGKWDVYQPPEVRPNAKILRLNAMGKWEVAAEPLHAGIDIEGSWGVGPGIAFAHELLATGSGFGVIGFVPCARTNSRIVNWQRGKFFYKELTRRANESLQEGGTIRALLWYQGESDTIFQEDADGYKENTEKFFKDLHSDLNIPPLLIIQVAIASGKGNFTDRIRNDQLEIKLPPVKLIDAKGLPLGRDRQHLTTDAQVQLGQKLAHAFIGS